MHSVDALGFAQGVYLHAENVKSENNVFGEHEVAAKLTAILSLEIAERMRENNYFFYLF
jgi:hypothetical protein